MRWEAVGLTRDEYERAVELLGREPNQLELEMIGVMWSEHCSYKSSRLHLRRLPVEGPQVLQGPGENAGVLDLGGETALALRCESHNHPTAIDPYQGAATGVGGILRDIFTMGARPAAVLSSMRFGEPADPGNRRLLQEAAAGIKDFCVGVGIAAAGGELYFEDCYEANPLVNVMALGWVPRDRIIRGRAEGQGNPVFILGGLTDRQGVRSASHASQEAGDSQADDSSIQVADPAMARRVMEACLELIAAGVVVGMNDLGAAGLTSASSETAYRAGGGIEINEDAVPLARPNLEPYEIMLSETQERMLVIVAAGREDEVKKITDKHQVPAAQIGRVTGDGRLRVVTGSAVLADLPVSLLTEHAPVYDRPQTVPAQLPERWQLPQLDLPGPGDSDGWSGLLVRMLSTPNTGSRRRIFEGWPDLQRERGVAVLPIPGGEGAVAATIHGNGRLAFLDPYRGAAQAVARAARKLACAGARPLGITNCLNMGNPERGETMWQFSQIIDGMAAAAQGLEIPVTGGNVSFYNDSPGVSIFPTPVIGMVGVIEALDGVVLPAWQQSGASLVVLGPLPGSLDGSEFLRSIYGVVAGRPEMVDLALEKRLIDLLLELSGAGALKSASDIGDGGLAMALALGCFGPTGTGIGAAVDLPGDVDPARVLFGEGPSRVLITASGEDVQRVLDRAAAKQVPATVIGTTGGSKLEINLGGRRLVDADLEQLWTAWDAGLKQWLV